LGLSQQDVNIIKTDYPMCEEACMTMLFKWHRMNAQPSWNALQKVIEKCKADSEFSGNNYLQFTAKKSVCVLNSVGVNHSL